MNWKENLFVFDSNELDSVQTHLYGYIVSECRIIDEQARKDGCEIVQTGIGSYDLIERKGNKITISQDFLGSQGIYLYQDEDYFALSNSELLLIERLKKDHVLTLNREYAMHLISAGHVVKSAEDTMIREISFLDRHMQVEIEIPERRLHFENTHYSEHTIRPDSAEGLEILDAWYDRWVRIFRMTYKETDNIEIDLSGGFDSRLSFAVMAGAGIDLNRIVIRSLNDGLHTHDEDFRIASQIAKSFDFPLNNYKYERLEDEAFQPEDVLGISLYVKGLEHKQMYYKYCFHHARKYRITGAGGEDIRARSANAIQVLIDQHNRTGEKVVSEALRDEVNSANRKIMMSGYARVKASEQGRTLSEEELTAEAVLDTWHRFHFGKDMLECYMCNEVKLLPLLDPELLKLKLDGDSCSDKNLLMALILVRYCPELLDYPVSGNRSIARETIAAARKINEKYPLIQATPQKNIEKQNITSDENGVSDAADGVPEEKIRDAIYMLMAHKPVRNAFYSVADADTYERMMMDSAQRVFHPLSQLFAVLAVGISQKYASESGTGKDDNFFGLMETIDCSDYISLATELLGKSGREKKRTDDRRAAQENEVKKLKGELEHIRNSRSYKTGQRLADIYHKMPGKRKSEKN